MAKLSEKLNDSDDIVYMNSQVHMNLGVHLLASLQDLTEVRCRTSRLFNTWNLGRPALVSEAVE